MPKIYTNKNGQKKDIGGPIQKPIYEQKTDSNFDPNQRLNFN